MELVTEVACGDSVVQVVRVKDGAFVSEAIMRDDEAEDGACIVLRGEALDRVIDALTKVRDELRAERAPRLVATR